MTPSRRRTPLPKNWPHLRRAVIARDGRCMWPDDGTPHAGPLEVDHIDDHNDHSLDNLQALCRRHHATKTGRQAALASAQRRQQRRRQPDRHPGMAPDNAGTSPGRGDASRLGLPARTLYETSESDRRSATGSSASPSSRASCPGTPAVCSSSTSDADTTTPTTTDGPTPCDQLAGTPTDEITSNAECATPDGGVELLGFAFHDCADGRRLSWNDHGYGYTGGTWQADARPDGQLIPPDADLEACTP